ncbi:hypothetical protein [Nonomuraea aridisoli]|uniref:Uncharacterized protein n=1 Tax=Nonomuraea aridisoli TaxID=2070368 RepID=A0A2W2EZY6_9ACTN|nr:hypothetical protein [Nonomuraea aridisoli]PZG18168.1 hypothetical protein C1J01_15905 [Nonomuraea aridisoli]
MSHPPQPQDPCGSQPPGQPYAPVPSGPQYGPVQYQQVKERGFNPVTFGVHLCLWISVHSWLTLFTLGLWLLVAITVTFFGWRVERTVPMQQHGHQSPPGY